MPIQTTDHIWHNGRLIRWEDANIHVMSHVVHYGSSGLRGNPVLPAAPWRGSLPAGRAYGTADGLSEDLPDASALYGGPALVGGGGCDRSQRRDALLHPANCFPWVRGDWRQSRCGLRLRCISPTFPGASTFWGTRRRCLRVELVPAGSEHDAFAGEGGCELYELAVDPDGSGDQWLLRGHRAGCERVSLGRVGREFVSRARWGAVYDAAGELGAE